MSASDDRRLLEIDGLDVSYGGEDLRLKGVNLSVARGEVVCMVGESGSGKSTLLRSIIGLLPPGGYISGGKVRFDGKDLAALTSRGWREIRGRDISMIFQNPRGTFDPIRRIGPQLVETIRCHRRLNRRECESIAEEILASLSLKEPSRIMRSYPFQLSGGMMQRVAIAAAMIFRPKLLLADEPTSDLDATTQSEIISLIANLKDEWGTSVLLVTHNMGIPSFLADNIGVMREGRIVEWGSRDSVIGSPMHPYTRDLLDSTPQEGVFRVF